MSKPTIQVVAAVIQRDGLYLLTQRQASAVFPKMWEFPGGRVESGETPEEALIREVDWRVGCKVAIDEKIGQNVHEYDAYNVEISLFSCSLRGDDEPQAMQVHAVRWVANEDLETYQFPPADQRSMTLLLNLAN